MTSQQSVDTKQRIEWARKTAARHITDCKKNRNRQNKVKNMIKKGMLILTAALLMAACCSCGENNKHTAPAAAQEETEAQPEERPPADDPEEPGASDKDVERFAEELGITDTESLRESVERMHRIGCSGIVSLTKTGEDGGWYYYVAEDQDGRLFYVDTNKHGAFGTVLTQTGMENAVYLSETLGLDGRGILYSSELLEGCGCGQIKNVEDMEHDRSYRFKVVDTEGDEFHIRMNDDGQISVILDKEEKPLYERKE